MAKSEIEEGLDSCAGSFAKIGCGLIALPIFIILLLILLGLL